MKHFIIFLIIFCYFISNAQEKQNFIEVNGTSELILIADQINFTIQIKIVDQSLEASKKTNDKNLDYLLSILEEMGINPHNIETSPITLGKNYEYHLRERKQNGFYTLVNVSFALTDLSKYFEITNRIASNDYFEIIKSDYFIKDYEYQHKAAYIKALETAKEKAAYMCKALEVKLGRVLEIQENDYWQSNSKFTNTFSIENTESASTNGKVTIRRSVKVKFEIE